MSHVLLYIYLCSDYKAREGEHLRAQLLALVAMAKLEIGGCDVGIEEYKFFGLRTFRDAMDSMLDVMGLFETATAPGGLALDGLARSIIDDPSNKEEGFWFGSGNGADAAKKRIPSREKPQPSKEALRAAQACLGVAFVVTGGMPVAPEEVAKLTWKNTDSKPRSLVYNAGDAIIRLSDGDDMRMLPTHLGGALAAYLLEIKHESPLLFPEPDIIELIDRRIRELSRETVGSEFGTQDFIDSFPDIIMSLMGQQDDENPN